MHRWIAGIALVTSAGAIGAQPGFAPPSTANTTEAATRAPTRQIQTAFEFAFPVYEMMRVRSQFLSKEGRAVNQLYNRKVLSGAGDRQVTAPNNDTLYSSAWLDLSGPPVLLDIPAMGSRYHSIELMDLFTDAFAVLGSRTDHGRAGRYMIVGPRWHGKPPAGVKLVRAPTNDVWLIGRTLINGPEDLAAAQAAQGGLRLVASGTPAESRAFATHIPERPSPAEFLDVVNAALARGPLPRVHQTRLARFAAAGIRVGKSGVFASLPSSEQSEWQRAMPIMYADLANAFATIGMEKGTWRQPAPGLAEFGQDDRYRSIVALGGLAALPLSEATYRMARVDQNAVGLDGHNSYELKLPAQIPVDGFWSVTLYQSDENGRWFFYPNDLGRYSIGNRTSNLVRDPDGGVTIRIQNAKFDGGNWLPAPNGPFRLSFRAYLPRPDMVSGRFQLPPVRKLP